MLRLGGTTPSAAEVGELALLRHGVVDQCGRAAQLDGVPGGASVEGLRTGVLAVVAIGLAPAVEGGGSGTADRGVDARGGLLVGLLLRSGAAVAVRGGDRAVVPRLTALGSVFTGDDLGIEDGPGRAGLLADLA